MRTTLRLDGTYGTPVAIMGVDGEWTEVGYVTDLEFTAEQDEWLPWESPFRIQRRYSMEMDVCANESAYQVLLNIMRAQAVVDSDGE